jgi:hypothetical protein
VVCEADKLRVVEVLAEGDFLKVFEIHVRRANDAGWYKRMTKLVKNLRLQRYLETHF